MKRFIRRSVHSLKTGWYIWLFPIFALLISGWLLYDYMKSQGPRVRIYFDDAVGIQPEKTRLRFRGVSIGTVKDVYISEDQKDVVVEVLLRKDAEDFAVEGSRFSLVTPKVGFQGISGLETLFEGTYIAVLPGNVDGPRKTDFKATSSSATNPLDDTSAYLIEMENAESVSAGDGVVYRGVKVGSVTKVSFAQGARTLIAQINIENRYVHLVRANTIFWRKVAVQAKLSLFGGSELKIGSMDQLMNGGLEFATPDQPAAKAKALQKFGLAPAAPKDFAKWKPVLD